jgi:hypothetical protein
MRKAGRWIAMWQVCADDDASVDIGYLGEARKERTGKAHRPMTAVYDEALQRCILDLMIEAVVQRPDLLRPDPRALDQIESEQDTALRKQGLAVGVLETAERTRVPRAFVTTWMGELIAVMAKLDMTSIHQLMIRYERLVACHWANLRADRFSIPLPQLPPGKLLDSMGVLALRFLVELAAAFAGGGSVSMADEVFHRLWCLADGTIRYGGVVDAVEGDLTDLRVIETGGRLRLAVDDLFENAIQDQARAVTIREAGVEEELPPDEIGMELANAVRAEVGASLGEIGLIMRALLHEALRHESVGVRAAERASLLSSLVEDGGFTSEEVDGAPDYLTLSPNAEFPPGPTRYPWRYRREHSYVTRPLVEIPRNGKRWVLWGPLSTYIGRAALGRAFLTNTRDARTQRLRDAMEKAASWRSKRFEQLIEEHFQADGRFVVRSGIEKPLGSRVCVGGTHLGDMDVVVIDAVCRLLVLIEVKALRCIAVRDPRPDRWPAMGGLGGTQAAASRRRWSWRSPPVRAAPAAARARGRDGTRGRPAGRDPAPARARQPRDHQHLPAGHRQQRDHQHRPRTAITDDLRHRRAPAEAIEGVQPGRSASTRPTRGRTPAWRDAGCSGPEFRHLLCGVPVMPVDLMHDCG